MGGTSIFFGGERMITLYAMARYFSILNRSFSNEPNQYEFFPHQIKIYSNKTKKCFTISITLIDFLFILIVMINDMTGIFLQIPKIVIEDTFVSLYISE